MNIFDLYAADPNKELEGVWTILGVNKDKTEAGVLVARSGNKRHGKVITGLYEANKTTLESKNEVADAKGEEITIEAMAKGVFLGWKGLEFKEPGEGGKLVNVKVPDSEGLTPEERLKWAKKLLGVKDFRNLISKLSEDFQKFKVVQDEADAGN